MRQHVNPLSKIYNHVEPIPPLKNIFSDINKPLHLYLTNKTKVFIVEILFFYLYPTIKIKITVIEYWGLIFKYVNKKKFWPLLMNFLHG